jgi:predicted NBD/HSP70 family sugar kinase
VLRAVRRAEAGASIADVIRHTHLSRPAVARALADLEETGFVARQEGPSTEEKHVGRPAQRFRFRAEVGFIAGLDIGPQRVHAILADLDGAPIHQATVETSPTGESVVRAAADVIHTGAQAAGVDPHSLWAIVVGTPGVVDTQSGTVRLAPSIPGWAGLPVAHILGSRYACPVLIDNDMNLAALAERSRGAAQGRDTFAYVHWDERVGTGLFLDGRPYRGATSGAGELGFLDLVGDLDRLPNPPGNAVIAGIGSFEELVGIDAIWALAMELTVGEQTAGLRRNLLAAGPQQVSRVLFDHVRNNNPTAATICERVTARFAAGLAAFVTLLDPGLVVIGGRVAEGGEDLISALREQLSRRALSEVTLCPSPLGKEAVALGAVQHALTVVDRRLGLNREAPVAAAPA